MFEAALHRRVVLAVLVAFAVLAAPATGAPADSASDASPDGNVSTDGDGAAAPDDGSLNASVRTGVSAGQVLLARNVSDQAFRIRTNASPGTGLDLEVETDTQLFTKRVTVGERGVANATFDLSDETPGSTFELSVRRAETGTTATWHGYVVNATGRASADAAVRLDDPKSEYRVRGVTTALAGTELELRVESPDSSFVRNRTVTVGPDGRYAATFDLGSLSQGSEVRFRVGGLSRSTRTYLFGNGTASATLFTRVVPPAEVAVPATGDAVRVASAPNQTIRGTTNAQPGIELLVTVGVETEPNTADSPNPYRVSKRVTVRENGTFAAAFDFGDVPAGTPVTVDVDGRGIYLERAEGRVVAASATQTTTPADSPTGSADEGSPTRSTTSSGDAPSDSVGEPGVPGFGVPVALLALLAGFAVARRN